LFGIMLAAVAAVMLRRGLRARRTEDAETAALGTAPRTDADAAVTSHDDPVLDQPGPAPAAAADGVRHHAREAEPPPTPARPPSPRLGVVIAAASLTGFLTGFFGVGGGFMVVPMLVIALGLAMRRASGTSLLVMVIATASSLLA